MFTELGVALAAARGLRRAVRARESGARRIYVIDRGRGAVVLAMN